MYNVYINPLCGLMYIGQTKQNLKLKIAEHKAARNGNMDYTINLPKVNT